MDAQLSGRRRYRPLYKTLTVGSNQYAIVDRDVAHHRADHYYKQALELIERSQKSTDDADLLTNITDTLLLATDLGSCDAPMLLAQRLLSKENENATVEDALVFLRLAAERKHAEAAYRLGCSYAKTGDFNELEALIAADPQLNEQERQRLAEHYLLLAIDEQHAIAIETLILAYAYGRPYLAKSASQFVRLCTTLIRRGNQAVALGFGAWLAGMTVEGQPPLADAIQLASNPELSLRYLLIASRGHDPNLACHALHVLCLGIEKNVWGTDLKNSKMKHTMIEDALAGNQLLALYLAWYSLEETCRPMMPDLMTAYPCAGLSDVFTPCVQRSVNYFELAVKGEKEEVTAAARGLSRHVFSGYVSALNALKSK